MRSLILFLAVGAFTSACGDNLQTAPGDDVVDIDAAQVDAAVPDAEVPDALVCPAREAGQVGGPCAVDDDCDSADGANDGKCWRGASGPSVFAPEGYCVLDDTTGDVCAADADCGEGNLCATLGGTYQFCIPACSCAGNACPANQACIDSFNGYQLDKSGCLPGNAAAEDGDACDGFYECNEFTSCRNDDLEFPGGECQAYSCALGTNVGCNGGHCITVQDPPLSGTTCVDTCTSNADCRAAEGYVCFDPDGDGTAPNFCRHARVGDACTADNECGGGAMECALPGAGFPGGYCTVTECTPPGSFAQCSPGSICHDPLLGDDPNFCADRCPTVGGQSTCRTGYTCVDTNPDVATVTGGCVPSPI